MKNCALLLLPSLVLLTPARVEAQEPDASQRDDVLALHRLELRPYGGWAAVPNSVTGAFLGADVTFRLNRIFALGGDVAWYAPFEGAVGASPAYPLNKTQWSADLDAYFVPWPAHARSGAAAGAFEPYLIVGLGAIATRPISVIDPANRHFDSNTNLVDLGGGLGVRLFLGDRVALALELRDLIYSEKIESGVASRTSQDASAWYDARAHVTNAIQLRLGASFFVGG
jgi:hypothetical protein